MTGLATELRKFAQCAEDDSNVHLADFLHWSANAAQKMEDALEHCEKLLMRETINAVNGDELEDEALAVIRSALKMAGRAA